MKIGDMVRWNGGDDLTGAPPDTGIIVDGPRWGTPRSYAVAWFDAKTTFWHLDFNLETLSEAR